MTSVFSTRFRLSDLRIRHKVFALISLIMAVGFAVTYAALSYAYATYDKQLYQKSSQVLHLSSAAIESELKKVEQLSYNVATDEGLQHDLIGLRESVSDYDNILFSVDIMDRLIKHAGNEKYIASIRIINNRGREFLAGQEEPIPLDKLEHIRRESAKVMGGLRWIYPDQENDKLIAARMIRSYKNFDLRPIGTLIIQVRLDEIVDDILLGTDLKTSELHIVAEGTSVYPAGDQVEGIAGFDGYNGKGYEILKTKEALFLSYFQSVTYRWMYYSVIPFDQIFNRIVWMKQVLLIGFAASLVLLFAVSIRFAQGITRPIEDLIERMKQVQRGNYSLTEMEALPMDEVGKLHRAFRMMIQEIDELIHENYEKQLLIRETQFKALQAQINPHFLYNTLDSVIWLAKVNGQKQISEIIEALGQLFRSSISLKETLITLGEELDIVRNYVTIQKFRFRERLNFEMRVDERYYSCLIPKMALQPLVENAIHYALEPSDEPSFIRLYSIAGHKRLTLILEDNGPGMDEDLLVKVRRGEARTRGQGIGLTNIRERLEIAFGDSYGLRIESENGAGTRVYVDIPMEMREKHA
ncbi:sensor histidine kinase [Paenibacillus alkalitolerans]|uniref:sensor histidine kinase n=1 Tax=Paenibacillus alkalitolerans TaxID=2799335 RepID=UPI0018F4D047|nr:histidine kinase [Paenibacillus alkalitolerans]